MKYPVTETGTIAQTYHSRAAIAITAVISDRAVGKFGIGEFYL
ncbi:hypothetical protein V2H45_15380 [Tumidithrix elongata RA019]|uniref:Uncharacterized protein n=1 Tax=Tumidithrix elongata BACA0141 TaxID=2716417 RepID=A0AAW9PZ41_9CYAN|nr:hypothetical protein [Tumidithrix elongata RA019]